MQAWIDSNPEWMFVIIPAYGIALLILVCTLLSYIGGWHTLASRFRAREPFSGTLFKWQSGQMRWIAGFGNSLNLGASEKGLFLSTPIPFRIGHPPLFIPWDEITVRRSRSLFMGEIVKFRLGREFSIPLWIGSTLAEKLQQNAGRSWPVEKLA